jgi:hypothetical protein
MTHPPRQRAVQGVCLECPVSALGVADIRLTYPQATGQLAVVWGCGPEVSARR